MVGKADVKTVVLPWYRKDDFALLQDEERATEGLGQCYDRWHSAAQAAVNRHLAAGYAVELVSVESQEFAAWLRERHRNDCLSSRIDFISQLVARSCEAKSPATAQ